MLIFRFIRDMFARFPLLLAANVAAVAVANLFGVLSIVTVAPVVDYFIHPDLTQASRLTLKIVSIIDQAGLPATTVNLLILFFLTNVLRSGLTLAARHAVHSTMGLVMRRLKEETLEKMFKASWAFFIASKQGVLINILTNELARVGEAFRASGSVAAGLFQVLFCLVVPFYLSWQTTLITLGAIIISGLPLVLLNKINFRVGEDRVNLGGEWTADLQETLAGAKVITGYGNQAAAIDRIRRVFERYTRRLIQTQDLNTAGVVLYEPLGIFVVLVVLFSAKRFGLALSDMAVMIWALLQAIPAMARTLGEMNKAVNLVPSYNQVISLQQRAEQMEQESGGRVFTGFERAIALEDLSFGYPGRGLALAGVNVRIPKNRMVAIVGDSGAGKSTLIDLILGFHRPSAGRVSVDGTSLDEFAIVSFRRLIGYVPQDPVLFNSTIRENLTWAKAEASREELEAACQKASALDFIQALPEGFDTVIGDRGLRLSGGQGQRLALARAVLRQPELLILDEATSALDTKSERLIQQAIETYARQTTIVVIAHRLSTVQRADYIYVLDRGRVVEEGGYDELLARGHVFARMVELQSLNGNNRS